MKQILASEEINKPKKVGLLESQWGVWDMSRKLKHLSAVVWDGKIITEFTMSRIGQPVLMMDVKVSKDKYISRCSDWENLTYLIWNGIKNHTQRRRSWSKEKKEVKHQMK